MHLKLGAQYPTGTGQQEPPDTPRRVFIEGDPSDGLTRDHIHDNITLYWLTETATSAAPPRVPGDMFKAPRSWAGEVYPSLTYFNEVEKGGHFAAGTLLRRAASRIKSLR
jgi:hypothetical protein